MSLQLLEGYSSGEEPAAGASADLAASSSLSSDGSSNESDEESEQQTGKSRKLSRSEPAKPPPDQSLPSALDAFAEITGPPEFLKSSVGGPEEEPREALALYDRKVRDRSRLGKKNLSAGAVVEAKAQLVAIRDRVSVDGDNTTDSVTATTGESKKKITAANPGPEDAADLLRMCLRCGIPKTYSHARGMVCPMCGNRPAMEPKESEKNKGSTVKDKEKSKRMRGQSSHATWKSETEMLLRQQFD